MNKDDKRPILIVDVLNCFIRNYSAFPTMNVHGEQMGGCVGTLKVLRRLVDEIQPRRIYMAWEGGGSTRRRSLYAEYKTNRRPEKLNRFYEDDIPDTNDNRKKQMITLIELLKYVAVCQLYVSDCEADDVVAYLCRNRFRDEKKIIVSSDKDMYQLLDDNTTQYSLHKKTYVTKDDVLKEFRVTSHNFAIAKAICGDASDNIPGVQGIGFKKIVKLFPLLGTQSDVLLQDFFDFCSSHLEESNWYVKLLASHDLIKRNWKLVYLDGCMMAASQIQHIDHQIDTYEPISDRIGMMRRLIKEGINDFDVSEFHGVFNCIDGMKLKQ